MAEVESNTLRELRTSLFERVQACEDELARAEMVQKEAKARLHLANSEAIAAGSAVSVAKNNLNQATEALKEAFPEVK